MTNQQIFDKVREHLLTQNARSNARSIEGVPAGITICMYRGPNGLKCAAGALIADEHYHPGLEGQQCLAFPVATALRASGTYPEEDWGETMLRDLQRMHDDDELPVDQWPRVMAQIACRYGLEVPA